jgi:hypothetical protein
MTEPTEEKKRPERVLVKPDPDSRLAGLLCLYERKKAAADEAEKAYEELKKSILAELMALFPKEEDRPSKAFDISGNEMYPPVSYTFVSKYYLSNPLIKEHMPAVYEAFKKQSTHWELRRGRS